MLYQNYRKRVIGLSNLLGFCHRFRVLILSICAFLFVLTVTLLSLSGAVVNSGVCPSEIEMGQNFDFGGGAIFAPIDYEYRTAGTSEWSTERPIRPGNYEARCVSHGIFGGNRYGRILNYTITPKTIEVVVGQDSVVYGDFPEVNADLSFADTITCNSFEYSDQYGASTDMTPLPEGITILDEKGNDVTYSYNLVPLSHKVTYLEREINIIVENAKNVFEYDGEPHTSSNYHIAESTPLASGDVEQLTFDDFAIDAGVTENAPAVKIMAGSVDVTARYKVNLVAGSIVVNKRPLHISSGDDQKIYDGKVLAESQITYLYGKLVDGQTATPTFTSSVNVGEYENSFILSVFDQNGRDVSANYDITYTFGNLKVLPREVSVLSDDGTWEYDGTGHTKPSFTLTGSTGFAEGQTVTVAEAAEIIDFGEKENVIALKITDGGEDVTANYSITYAWGNISVTKRRVNLITDSAEYIYNGSNQRCVGHHVENIVPGHTTVAVTFTERKDVGGENNVLTVAFYDAEGNDVTNNYNVAQMGYGVLTITQRPVTFKPVYAEKVYDGTALMCNDTEEVKVPGGGLIDGHTWEASTLGSIIDKGESENAILTSSVKIYDADHNDITANYVITTQRDKLCVTARPIYILSSTVKRYYDGTPLTAPNVTAMSQLHPALVLDHEAIPVINSSITLVGSVENVIDDVQIVSGSGINVTANYEITRMNGTLTVESRPITVTSDNEVYIFDDETHKGSKFTYNEGGLAPEQNIQGTFTAELRYVGTVLNFFTVNIFDKDGNEVTQYYTVTYKYQNFTIQARPITIAAGSAEKYYDNLPLSSDNIDVLEGDLVPGHYIVGTCEGVQVNAGTNYNRLTSYKILNSEGVDTTSNYEVQVKNGSLVVNKRPVRFTASDTSFVYDGAEHISDYVFDDGGGVHQQYYVQVVCPNRYIDVTNGPVPFVATIRIYAPVSEGGGEMTDNYDITYILGTIEITPRPITVTADSAQKPYDGTALTLHTYKVTSDYEPPIVRNQVSSATFTSDSTITDFKYDAEGNIIGVPNKISEFKIYDGSRDVSANYKVTLVEGELKIVRGQVVVQANSAEKVYDGQPLVCNEYRILSGNILSGEIRATVEGTVTQVQRDGWGAVISVPNRITSFKVFENGVDISERYDFVLLDGSLTIQPRPVVITTGSAEKVYDGQPLVKDEYTVRSDAYPDMPFADGDDLDITITGSATNVVYRNNQISGTENASVIIITNKAGEDVTSSYDLVKIYGMLTINPRPITVTAGSGEKPYDDVALKVDTYEITSDLDQPLVSGHTANVTINSSARYVVMRGSTVGTNANKISRVVIMADGEAVTNNYAITLIDGTLKITPIAATVKTDDGTWVYDGNSHSQPTCTFTGVIEGQTYRVNRYPTITEVGRVSNEFAVQIINADRMDVTVCYTLTYDYGWLEVTQRPITVTADSDQKPFDGQPLVCLTYKITSEYDPALVRNQNAVVRFSEDSTITDIKYDSEGNIVGVPNKISEVKIYSGSREVTSNYKINLVDGELKITEAESAPGALSLTAGGLANGNYVALAWHGFGNAQCESVGTERKFYN